MSTLAAIGQNVYVGNFLSCDQYADQYEFPYTIHIWHPEDNENGLCKHLLERRNDLQPTILESKSQGQFLMNLNVEYKKGDRLIMQEERVEGEYEEVKINPDMSIEEWKSKLALSKPKPPISVPLEEIVNFARQEPNERLLVHDALGVARAPIIAWACKIARGANPFLGIAELVKGCWEGMFNCPELTHGPCTDVLQHFDMHEGIEYTKYGEVNH